WPSPPARFVFLCVLCVTCTQDTKGHDSYCRFPLSLYTLPDPAVPVFVSTYTSPSWSLPNPSTNSPSSPLVILPIFSLLKFHVVPERSAAKTAPSIPDGSWLSTPKIYLPKSEGTSSPSYT